MLFINPANEKFGGMLSRYIPVGIPVALGVLFTYLRKWGVKNLRIVDEEIEKITPENIQQKLSGLDRPLIVGITVLTSQAGRAYEIAKMIKEFESDATIILGNVHVTTLPQEPLEMGLADFVVRGEGEETLRELYFALREGKDWKNIKGISYRNENGKIISNPDNDLIENLDDVPIFPYELFDHPRYDKGFLTGARGCPYKCTYCSQRLLTGFTYRWHSTERIVENLNILINQYGQTSVTFYDDIFSVNKKRVLDLCEGIVKSGLNKKCSFAVQTRADNVHEDLLPAMVKANFKTVGMGMETGVERIAAESQKGQTVAQHLEAIKLCKKYGLKVSLFMIYGFPGETKKDRDESFAVTQKADVGYIKFNNLIPYPGTPIYETAKKNGTLHITPGWLNCNSTLSITRSIFSTTPLPYVPEGTTEFELKQEIIRRNLQGVFQWKIIKSILTRDKGPGWVALPPKWYLKPKEIGALGWMSIVLGTNLIFSLLPSAIGNSVFSLVKRGNPIKPPEEDIKVTERSFKRAKAPDVDARHLRADVQEERLESETGKKEQVSGRAPWLQWSTTE
jgi:anaerobic magnesium-protoporphyrin IX monomethyl ester cyclase